MASSRCGSLTASGGEKLGSRDETQLVRGLRGDFRPRYGRQQVEGGRRCLAGAMAVRVSELVGDGSRGREMSRRERGNGREKPQSYGFFFSNLLFFLKKSVFY